MGLVIFNEVVGLLAGDALYVADLVAELDSVKLVRVFQKLWSEGGRNELGVFRQFVDHVGHALAVLCVQSLSTKCTRRN